MKNPGFNTDVSVDRRYEYLIECSRSSHEQILQHSKQRHAVLKLQMISQAALFALATGVTIGGVSPVSHTMPDMLALAFPMSAFFAALYTVEDRLVVHFCEYFGSLSETERRMAAVSPAQTIRNSEVSPQMRSFAQTTLPVRLFAQIVAFLIMPICLHLCNNSNACALSTVEIVIDGFLLFSILVLLMWSYHMHKRVAGHRDN